MKLTILMVAKNAEKEIKKTLKSVEGLGQEVLVLDNASSDSTRRVALKFGAKVFLKPGDNLGELKNYLEGKVQAGWILFLDSDEVVSRQLYREIQKILKQKNAKYVAYRIFYKNHVFGRPVRHGGENYSKIRLYLKGGATIRRSRLHEEIIAKGNIGRIGGKIYHYSYKDPWSLFSKFTRYALVSSQIRADGGEVATARKLIAYGPHMFLSRFVNEKGYLDGIHGFIIALAFSYMEQMTYIFLFLRNKNLI